MVYKIEKYCLFGWLSLLISPILCIPFAFYGMIKVRKWGFSIWAVFMGLLGILYPPTGDIYRYYVDFKTISNVSWDNFIFFLTFRNDYLLFLIEYILSRLNLNFEIYKFLYNFISYYLLGNLFIDIVNCHNKKLSPNEKILFLFTIITFSISSFLFRFDFSKILFIYGSYKIIYSSNNYGWLYVFVACLNHLSIVILAFFLLLAKYKLFSFSRQTIIIICLICMTIDPSLATSILKFLPVSIINHYAIYLDGYWAGDFLNDHSLLFRLQRFISIGITYIAILIYIAIYNKRNLKKENLVNGMILITTLSSPFITIFYRFSSVLFLVIKFYFLRYYNYSRKSYYCLIVLFALTMTSNFMGLWSIRRQIEISKLEQIVFPAPYIICFSYSDSWVSNNVFDNGDFKHD